MGAEPFLDTRGIWVVSGLNGEIGVGISCASGLFQLGEGHDAGVGLGVVKIVERLGWMYAVALSTRCFGQILEAARG